MSTSRAELGLQAALTSRMRPIDSLSLILRISLATTLSYLLARAVSGSALPIFAPITTLFVVQSSPFTTLGVTAQRVLGTGLGVLAATVYVTWLPVTWWSVFVAVLVSLLAARALPVGMTGQLQIPVAVVFVLALGPGDLSVDLWRVLDVALGAVVGVAAVFVLPPRPRLDEARVELAAYADELAGLLAQVAAEAGTHPVPLHDDTRHAFIRSSRALRVRAVSVRDAVTQAAESTRFNPRARALGVELEQLEDRMVWLTRLAIHCRSLAGSVDRVYDRPGPAPALPRAVLADLLGELGSLLRDVSLHGLDEDTLAASDRMAEDVRVAVEVTTASGDVVAALDSLTLLGRLEQLRESVAEGPRRVRTVEDAMGEPLEDDAVDPLSGAGERIRRMLGRD